MEALATQALVMHTMLLGLTGLPPVYFPEHFSDSKHRDRLAEMRE